MRTAKRRAKKKEKKKKHRRIRDHGGVLEVPSATKQVQRRHGFVPDDRHGPSLDATVQDAVLGSAAARSGRPSTFSSRRVSLSPLSTSWRGSSRWHKQEP